MTEKPPTHWIVPFASSLSEPCQQAWARLNAPALPNLSRLLARLRETARVAGDEYALSMPHERVLARELGWPDAADGELPLAAWWAAHDGLALSADQAWGLLSPGHWLMGREHLTLLDPATLALTEAESRTLFEAVRPLFEEDGWTLHWGAPQRWYAAHPSLAGLPTASLDRVIGRNPDLWLTDHPQARLVRRLQSEVQMLLYQHPVNEARESQGLATVNSFWLSGCGLPPAPGASALPPTTLPATTLPAATRLITTLRTPLLADDIPLWLQAWQALDATDIKAALEAAEAGLPVRLTLCGERQAVTMASAEPASAATRLWQAVRRWTGQPAGSDPAALLREL